MFTSSSSLKYWQHYNSVLLQRDVGKAVMTRKKARDCSLMAVQWQGKEAWGVPEACLIVNRCSEFFTAMVDVLWHTIISTLISCYITSKRIAITRSSLKTEEGVRSICNTMHLHRPAIIYRKYYRQDRTVRGQSGNKWHNANRGERKLIKDKEITSLWSMRSEYKNEIKMKGC